jgi:hypothetical protein
MPVVLVVLLQQKFWHLLETIKGEKRMFVHPYLPYLLVVLGVVMGLVVFFYRRKGKIAKQSHRIALGLGVVWIALGVIFQNSGISALGGLLILLGVIMWWRGRLNPI